MKNKTIVELKNATFHNHLINFCTTGKVKQKLKVACRPNLELMKEGNVKTFFTIFNNWEDVEVS